MEDGYITPEEQIIINKNLKCPDTPRRQVLQRTLQRISPHRPNFFEPLRVRTRRRLALPLIRPSKGRLTLLGYGSSNQKK